MKKIFSFFLCLSISACVCGQQKGFSLSGRVTDCRTNAGLRDAEVRLFCSDGRSLGRNTDSSGSYLFDSTILLPGRAYAVTVSATALTNTVNLKSRWGYLSSADKFRFNIADTMPARTIKNDFCLVRIKPCTYGPREFIFEKNSSTRFYDADSIDDPLAFTVMVLEDNPGLTFAICGHAGKNEKAPQQLSEARANLIRTLLIRKGIAAERLTIRPLGTAEPYTAVDAYGHSPSLQEIELKSPRVALIPTGNNYQPEGNQPAKPAKATGDDDE